MKIFKYFTLAVAAIALVACGDDEPSSTFVREFNMIYPQLPAGHKLISKVERIQENGAISEAVVDYDSNNHPEKITATYRDKSGDVYNKEVIHFDYKNGAIVCDKKIQPVTYSFEVNNQGAITKLTNVSSGRTASALTYNYDGKLEVAQTITPSSTDVTRSYWEGDNLKYWTLSAINKTDSVVYDYTNAIPNKGGIDVTSNNPFTFTILVCEIMRNAGFYGTTSSQLPSIVLKDGTENPETHTTVLKSYSISYVLDNDGYVTSYTTTESPKCTVKYTYR